MATIILAQNSDSKPEEEMYTMQVDDWSPTLGGLRSIAPQVTATEKQKSRQRYLQEVKRGLSFKRQQARRYGRTPLPKRKSSVMRLQGLHSVVRYTID
jgi:hypothetical protein